MSATAALMPQPPPQTQMLSLAASNTSSLSKRSSESPRSGSSKVSVSVPSLVHQATAQRRESPSEAARKSPALQASPKLIEDHKPVSPSPEKFPEPALPAAPSPKEPVVSPPSAQQASMTGNPIAPPRNKNNDDNNDHLSGTASNKAPAQLALLLSQALADADALRRDLASEKKRVARAERLLAALQAPPSSPNSATTVAEARNVDGRLPESAAKAILDAETRAEHAERVRDEALHALASLSASFAELERYEATCALRSSDARGAYLRLLANLTSTHPLPQSSPAASTSSPRDELRLNLPRVPAPLPSLPSVIHLPGPSVNAAPPHGSTQPSRYSRSLQAQSTYAHAQSPVDTRQANAFESLPLPPPPAATGLASINTSLPVKRHRSRLDEAEYEEQKRRRLIHEMDIDVAGPDAHAMCVPHASSRHYQSGPPSAQPLSAHPTVLPPFTAGPSPPSRLFDRPPSVQYGYPASGPNYQREGIPSYAPSPGSRYATYDEREREYNTRDRESAGGVVRIDARELVREAKARERRGRDRESYSRLPHSDLQVQQRSQGEFHANERSRRRSASGSSVRSKSSLSLDEMLLETATDGGVERGRPAIEQPATGSRQSQAYAAPQSGNGIVSPQSAAAVAASPTSQPIAKAPSTHAAPATNGIGRKASIPASQLMTLGPSGTILSGGGADAGASVDPAVRFPGLRTCRQCLQPGRYKEGKCVEKWGPGPQGPGTVCDRCRKKMKRVERRGTLDSSASLRGGQSQSQKASQATTLSLAPSQSQSQSQSQVGRTRAAPPARTDTLIVETERRTSDSSQTRSPGNDSRYHHTQVPPASAAARHPSLASGQAHSQYGTTSHSHSHSDHQIQHAQSRRAPTPPYITAISSREQHNTRHANSNARHVESDDDLLDDEGKRRQVPVTRPTANGHGHGNGNGNGNGSGNGNGNGNGNGSAGVSGARYTHSESYTRQPLGDERDELAEDAEGDADADADGSGVGSADAEPEDADIMDAVDATMKVED